MAVDRTEMDVGPPAASGGFFSNKRNLLLLAAIGGGAAGLFILMSRRASGPTGESATGGTPYNQTQLQLGNLANQLLQFRGETSIQNADITAAIGNSTDRQNEIAANLDKSMGANQGVLVGLLNLLSGQVTGVGQQVAGVAGQVNEVSGKVDATSANVDKTRSAFYEWLANLSNQVANEGVARNEQWQSLYGSLGALGTQVSRSQQLTVQGRNDTRADILAMFTQILQNQNAALVPAGYSLGLAPGYTQATLPTNQLQIGAGGFSANQFVAGVNDAGHGNGDEWLAAMSNGPVRFV